MPDTCPRCGGSRVHHSRLRSWWERARRRLTGYAPYRCHACHWRGWRRDTDGPPRPMLREIQPPLTDDEVARLEVDSSERR